MNSKSINRDKPHNLLPNLPPKVTLETPEIFKSTIRANKLLAELKGFCQTLPNPELLLNTIVLQESKESSAIENIVTTQDELYKATLMGENVKNQQAKEVLQYRRAMYYGLQELDRHQLITTNLLVGVMQILRNTTEGIRRNPGTKLSNPSTNKIVYTPPEGIENKSDYYRLLREVTEHGNWQEWVLYVVDGVAETSLTTLEKIKAILALKSEAEHDLKNRMRKIFTRELNDLLFSHPYIKIGVLEDYGIAKRQTASRYLKEIEKTGWLTSVQVWKETYYINHRLIDVLSN